MHGETTDYNPSPIPSQPYSDTVGSDDHHQSDAATLPVGKYSYRLGELAYLRSGDKGNICNIGMFHVFCNECFV